jgi:hypothetical protein
MEKSEIKIYKTPDGKTSIEVKLEKETVWLNQYQLEELFETNRTTVNKHIINIYKSGELNEESTCAKIAQVQKENQRCSAPKYQSPGTEQVPTHLKKTDNLTDNRNRE